MDELSGISGKLMDDAQDMMKRLRSGEDGLEYAAADILEAMSIAPVFAALRASQAEIARLREALGEIAFARKDRVGPGLSECISIARAALKGEPG